MEKVQTRSKSGANVINVIFAYQFTQGTREAGKCSMYHLLLCTFCIIFALKNFLAHVFCRSVFSVFLLRSENLVIIGKFSFNRLWAPACN